MLQANSSTGFWLTSTSSGDPLLDNAVYIYTSKSVLAQVAPGDIVTLDAKMAEYRSNVDYLFLTD